VKKYAIIFLLTEPLIKEIGSVHDLVQIDWLKTRTKPVKQGSVKTGLQLCL